MARIDTSHGLNERSVTWENDLEIVMEAVRTAGCDDIVRMFQSVEMLDCEWNEVEEGMTRFLLTTSKGMPWALDAWRVRSSNDDVQAFDEDVREAFRMLDVWVAAEERRTEIHCPGLRRSIARVRTMARMFLDAILATKRFRTEVELALQGKRSERYYDAEIEWLVAVGNVEQTGRGLQIRSHPPLKADMTDVTSWGVDIGDTPPVKGMRGPMIKDPRRKSRLVADNSPPPPGATLFPGQKKPEPAPKIAKEKPRFDMDARHLSDASTGSPPVDGGGGTDGEPCGNDSLQRVFDTLSSDPDTATAENVDETLRESLGSKGDPLYEDIMRPSKPDEGEPA